MGLFFALTIGAWLAGGLVCAPWIFWLDRERREFGGPVKAAVLFAWPILMPALLYKREDLSGPQAARSAATAMLLVFAGPAYESFSPPPVTTGVVTGGVIGGLMPYDPGAVQRKINAQMAKASFHAGMSRYERAEYHGAIQEWTRCLSLAPGDAACKAGVLLAHERLSGASDILVVGENERRIARRRWSEGLLYYEKGEYARAAEEWSACLRADPADHDCRTFLARVGGRPPDPPQPKVARNDKREAVRYWNSGIIYYQRGDFEKARDEWGACLRLDPVNSDCATGLQRIDQSYGSAP